VDPFFGELYLRSTRPFLSEPMSDAEGAFLRARLPGRGPLLDVGCGHGRHLQRLSERAVVGVDLDPLSLAEARAIAPVARGDFRRLPFRDGAFAGAYAWYNTLGTVEPDVAQGMLVEIGRCLGPGGTFIVQGSHPARAREQPHSAYDGQLADGCVLVEEAHFDAAGRRDRITRTLKTPEARVMAASFFIRYYEVDEWRGLLAEAGLDVQWACGGVDGAEVTATSADIILGARKRA
jgi:SAM-dependent methyltransferase